MKLQKGRMTVLKMSVTKTVACVALAAVAMGCASGGGAGGAMASKGMDQSAKIQSTLNNWQAGVMAKDLNKLMSTYSESFSTPDYADKAAMAQFVKDTMEQGAFDGAKVDLSKSKTVIDPANPNKAAVGPVDLTASFGGATLNFTMGKESNGEWLITTMTVETF